MANNELVSDLARDAERAGAGGNGHVPLLRGYIATARKLQYASALSAVWGSYELPDPSTALASDADAYEVVLRDAVVCQVDAIRRRAAAGKTWRLIPGDDTPEAQRLADILTDILKQNRYFTESRYELASAIIRGTSYGYMRGSRRTIRAGGVTGRYWVCNRIVDIDPRRITWRRVGGSGKMTRHIWSVRKSNWVPIPRHWPLIAIVYQDEEARLGSGRGLLDPIYINVYFKVSLRMLAGMAIDAHGRGILTAAIDSLRAGSSDKTPEQMITDWTTALNNVRAGSNVLVYDANDQFDVHIGGEHASSEIREWGREINDENRSLVLGASLGFGGNAERSGGGRALGNTESNNHESVTQYDRQKLGEDMKWQVVDRIRILNRIPLAEYHGIGPEVPTPDFVTEAEIQEDMDEHRASVETIHAAGGGIVSRELYEKLGWEMPPGTPPVLEPPAPEPPMGGMMGGGPFGEPGPEPPGMPGPDPDKKPGQDEGEGPVADGESPDHREPFARMFGANTDTAKLYMYIRVPEHAAKQYPTRRAGGDNSPAHVTVAYFGDQPVRKFEGCLQAITRGASKVPTFSIEGRGRAAFHNVDDGTLDAVYTPVRDLDGGLANLREQVRSYARMSGIEWDDTHPEYIPHATIKYVPTGSDIAKIKAPDPWFEHVQSMFVSFNGQTYEVPIGGDDDAMFRAQLGKTRQFDKWVTIGSNKSAPDGEKGGTPVQIDGEGVIQKGPSGTVGNRANDPRGAADRRSSEGWGDWADQARTEPPPSSAPQREPREAPSEPSGRREEAQTPGELDDPRMKAAREAHANKPAEYWGGDEQPYWKPGPNPTVDAVITREGSNGTEILMIQRGEGTAEGGKWALPGGFHDSSGPQKGDFWKPGKETAQEAAARELTEETGLGLPPELVKNLRETGTYDEPGRDPRDNNEAWSVSTAFALDLTGDDLSNAAVQGMDDAQNAEWVPLSELGTREVAFDHRNIIRDATGQSVDAERKDDTNLPDDRRSREAQGRAVVQRAIDSAAPQIEQKTGLSRNVVGAAVGILAGLGVAAGMVAAGTIAAPIAVAGGAVTAAYAGVSLESMIYGDVNPLTGEGMDQEA